MASGGNPVIATAALGLIPTVQGIRGNIGSQLAGSAVMAETDRAGRSIGSKLGASITSTLKTGLKIGGVVTGAIAGLTLKGGINRALGIEDAQAMMRGLGHDTETVDKIMGNALASVEGTAFGLDAAATSAAGAVAAGIKPGEQLEQTMKTVANVAAGAKAPMEEIGGIFNTVAAVGTAYTGDINMIAQRGIPIWQALGDQLGKSQDEVKKMASKGEIDFATFEKAAREAAGGVATAMGDTTRGSIANMLTSFSKLGADVVTRFMPMVKAGATGIQRTVQAITKKLGPVLDHLFEGFTPSATAGVENFFAGLVSWIDKIDPQVIIDFLTRVGDIGKTVFGELKGGITAFGAAWEYNDGEITSSGFPGFMERAGYMARQLWDSLKRLDFSSFSAFLESLGAVGSRGVEGLGGAFSSMGGSLLQIAQAAPDLLASGLELLGSAMGFLAEHSDTIVKLLPYIVAGFATYKLATQGLTAAITAQRAADIATLPVQIKRNVTSTISALARNRATVAELRLLAATNASAATTTRATIAERGRAIAQKAQLAVQKAVTAAQWLWNAAMSANPIGLVIAGIVALVGALVLFFTKTEVGRKIWETVWGAIKNAAMAVVDWFVGTALPWLQSVWDGIAAGALWLYNSAILPAWNGIKAAIQVVGDWITGTLWPAIQTAWDAIGAAAMWLYQSVILPAWNGIKLAIAIVVTAVIVYIDLLKWYWTNVLAPVAKWLYNSVILPVWNSIKTAISAVIDWFVNTGWPLLKSAWDAVSGAVKWLYENAIKPAWNGIKAAIDAVVVWFQGTAWPIVEKVVGWLKMSFEGWKLLAKIVWDAVKSGINAVVGWFRDTAWPIVRKVIDLLKLSFEGWKLLAKAVWDAVKSAINTVVSWFRDTAWPAVRNVIDRLKDGFNSMKDRIKAAWDFVKNNAIKPVADWLTNTIKPKIDQVTGNIKDAFDTMKEGIKKAWDAIKDAAKTPVRFVVEDVYMETLRATFNGVADKLSLPEKWRLPARYVNFKTGGVMPGYTPGRDVHRFWSPTGGRLDLSGGEAIMRPEWTRAVGGPAAVEEMNRKARRGEAFAGGGVWGALKGFGGDAWDWITDKASTIAEAVSDPLGILTKLAGKAAELIPGDGMMRAATVQVAKNAGSMMGEWLKGQLAPAATDGVAGPVSTKGGGSLSLASQIASGMGLRMTSGYRPGSRTAGTGSVSYHSLGRARDYAGSAAAMMRFFNAMHPYKPTELLYSPAGGRQWRRWGAQQNTSGVTKRMHYNHVHVAFKDGGIMPSLYDQGGEVPPGLSVIANKTRRPEKVLPPAESTALTRVANALEGQEMGGDIYNIYAQTDKATELVGEVMWAQKTQRRRGRYATAGR